MGDIRDYDRCEEITRGADIVIHAAAIKHVNIAEYNPYEVTKTNVLGTENILRASIANKVSKFLLISTDKVVSPVNMMGISKLQSEKIALNAEETKGKSKTKVSLIPDNASSARSQFKATSLLQLKLGINKNKIKSFFISNLLNQN